MKLKGNAMHESPSRIDEIRTSSPEALVVIYERILERDDIERIELGLAKELDRRVIVLDGGPRLYDGPTEQRLASLERSLSLVAESLQTLLKELELTKPEDPDDDAARMDLEGNRVGAPRDPHRPL